MTRSSSSPASAVGQPLAADGIAAIEQRLKASGHFDSVEIRKRYRSLDSTTDVALILLVHERAGFTSETVRRAAGAHLAGHRLKSKLMFLPILGYDDGYGFTYGGRVSTIGLLGDGRAALRSRSPGAARVARRSKCDRTFKQGR